MNARTTPIQTSKSLRPFRALLSGAVGACVLAAATPAFAQADLSPPMPDVLLLVDTSGSMEFKVNGDAPVCNPNQPSNPNDRSRWIDLLEVLTGTIDKYSCEALSRSTPEFVSSYKFGTDAPYDYQYPIPFHRPLSNGCGAAPGTPFSSGQNPFKYPQGTGIKSIDFHQYNWGASCSGLAQPSNDGVLDTFRSLVRFGLMTFDSSVGEGRGYDGTSVNFATGKDGLWSYYLTNAAQGQPSACHANPVPKQEVGSRNNAAPPWEGRLINFGNPDDGVRAYETKNTQIQEVLISTRPYGATPIAGMLQDAKDFLLTDNSPDPDPIPASPAPTGVKGDFGPYQDPYLACGRTRSVILLTDGLPNMDLRPSCEATTTEPQAQCPYEKPELITQKLRQAGVPTYVVGFALDSYDDGNGPKTCDKVDCTGVTIESPEALQACCALEKIAVEGGGHAYFAKDKAALRSQIHAILSQSVNTTSRTQPAVASGDSGAGSYRFFSGFVPGKAGTAAAPGRPWEGVLDRQRWICDKDDNLGIKVPKPVMVDEGAGDKFVTSVGNAGPDGRVLYTFIGGAPTDTTVKSRESMRPLLKGDDPNDGVGNYGAHLLVARSNEFVNGMPNAALDIPAANCVKPDGTVMTNPTDCSKFYMNWLVGYNNGTEYKRCPNGKGPDCDLVGDIFHSTPQTVGPPSALARDDSYAKFAYDTRNRPTVLYTSSNDGFLHAFRIDGTSGQESPELWAFIPPATLPNLYSQYPFSHGFLLDGVPVISDVVAVKPTTTTGLPMVFERTEAAAQQSSNVWRTVLVQSFGGEHPGYFALDVTNPVPDSSALTDPEKGGPRMLWQLTNDSAGKNLFGRGGATPAITTLFFDPEGGTSPREIPVAVLPGGPGGTPLTTVGPTHDFDGSTTGIEDAYKPRKQVRGWDLTATPGARSLTIVRLDTGEIIRTFRQKKNEIAGTNTYLQNKVIEVAELESPITGQPVAYPGLIGAVSDRIYVGDSDGRLWKVDVSSRNPAEWKMKLFFDLYPAQLDGSPSGLTFSDGQPMMTVPVLSVDELGNVTVNAATGDQDGLGSAPNQKNYVYSITEELQAPSFTISQQKVNWYTPLTAGERVVGPLQLFNGNLYFASFKPAESGTPCKSGASRVWAMDYIEPMTEGTDGNGGAVADFAPKQSTDLSSDAVVYGVSVVQQPSCYDVAIEDASIAFLGFGQRRTFSNVQSGKFQLVMHMGNTPQGTGNTANTGAGVSSRTIDLTPPSNASSVTGWASVLE